MREDVGSKGGRINVSPSYPLHRRPPRIIRLATFAPLPRFEIHQGINRFEYIENPSIREIITIS